MFSPTLQTLDHNFRKRGLCNRKTGKQDDIGHDE